MACNDKLLQQFSQIDADKNNELSCAEVTAFLSKNGFPPEYIKKVMEKFDANKDGKITKAEFEKCLKSQTPKQRQLELWQAVFNHYDKDKSGKLSCAELQEILGKDNYDKQSLQNFLKEHDKDKDGQISWNEFLKYLNSH